VTDTHDTGRRIPWPVLRRMARDRGLVLDEERTGRFAVRRRRGDPARLFSTLEAVEAHLAQQPVTPRTRY